MHKKILDKSHYYLQFNHPLASEHLIPIILIDRDQRILDKCRRRPTRFAIHTECDGQKCHQRPNCTIKHDFGYYRNSTLFKVTSVCVCVCEVERISSSFSRNKTNHTQLEPLWKKEMFVNTPHSLVQSWIPSRLFTPHHACHCQNPQVYFEYLNFFLNEIFFICKL